MIDDKLLTAYHCAKYIVEYEGQEYPIQVGETCEIANRLLSHHKVHNGYFITPENPLSCLLSDDENIQRHARFLDLLHQRNCVYLSGYGTDEAQTWPKEVSYLIFTDDELWIKNLAADFGQNAFLKLTTRQPTQLYVLASQHYVPR
ncbi:DUF3293 domain-containing protein [Aliiglaciecola litoralis]|uniref:DUF3293 domain-containing protein n=1 Tax=Aliiglaciecola litoralis TaxID=582857 RepID=A0ABP3X1B9_9ALTE